MKIKYKRELEKEIKNTLKDKRIKALYCSKEFYGWECTPRALFERNNFVQLFVIEIDLLLSLKYGVKIYILKDDYETE